MVCKAALFAQFRYSAQLCITPKQAQHEQAPVLIALGRFGNALPTDLIIARTANHNHIPGYGLG